MKLWMISVRIMQLKAAASSFPLGLGSPQNVTWIRSQHFLPTLTTLIFMQWNFKFGIFERNFPFDLTNSAKVVLFLGKGCKTTFDVTF